MAAPASVLAPPSSPVQTPRRWPVARPGLLDLYVLVEMVMPFVVTLFAAIVIFLGNELFWSLYNILYLNVSPDAVLRWLLYSVPKICVLAAPVATVFAVSMGTHRLARENEITAWRMAGASVLRIMMPFFAFALALSMAVYWLNERVVPWTTHAREVIMNQEIRRADPVNWIESDSFFKGGDGYTFYVRRIDHTDGSLNEIVVYRPRPSADKFLEVIVARRGHREGRKWILEDCIVHEYDTKTGERIEKRAPTMEAKLGQFIIEPRRGPMLSLLPQKSNSWEMSRAELSRAVRSQEALGLRTPMLQQWRVEIHHKFSLPLGALAVAFAAAPLALCFARSGSFAGFLVAVTLVFFYQGFDGWFVIMGYKAWLPPVVAAWLTNVMYMVTGLVLLARQR